MAAKFTPEQLQALHEAQALAHKIHTEFVVPSNASLDVRMNAISVLAAELEAAELMKPAAEDILQKWPVSKRINSSRTPKDDPTLIEPVELAA
jgi:putative SOS response-associated peptidase YedK